MRDKIIKYLQGIQCEWFPVEWDRFVYDFLGSIRGYSEVDLQGARIRYTFTDTYCYVEIDRKKGISVVSGVSLHYFTLDRCKTLLLNAVRSVDEPKRKAGDWQYEIESNADLISIIAFRYDDKWCQNNRHRKIKTKNIVWQNGEFK